jgi:predicted TIM-barrel fold metal-dependent hydrolase
MGSQRIIDADGHIREAEQVMLEYFEPPYRPMSLRALFPSDGWDRHLQGRLLIEVPDAAAWLKGMELGGMDTAVLFPTLGLFHSFIHDPDIAVAVSRAYNSYVAEQYHQYDAHLRPVALLPLQDVDEAVKELRRAVTELGLVGAMLAADGPQPLLGHKQYLPLYAEAQALHCPLGIHASGSHLGGAGVELFPRFIQTHTASHPFGIMRQITSIVFEGIPEKFPDLRLAFLEAGVTWVPHWIDRMDEEYEKRGEVEAPDLHRKPSEVVFGGNVYFSIESGERLLGATVNAIGEDIVFYASDYPHWDAEYPESITDLRQRSDLTDEQKAKIFATNAQAFFNLA